MIILPPIALYNAERERLAERHGALRWFEEQLKELDPHLTLVKASEAGGAAHMRPGYWHVKMTDPETGWQHYMVIEGPDGQFMEPHSGVIDKLREHDLRRPGAFEEMLKQLDARDAAHASRQKDWHEAMKVEFAERYANKANASVSMANQGKGWRYRARRA